MCGVKAEQMNLAYLVSDHPPSSKLPSQTSSGSLGFWRMIFLPVCDRDVFASSRSSLYGDER